MLSFSPMLFDARIQKEAQALRDAGYLVKNIYLEDQRYLSGIKNLTEAQENYNRDMHGIQTIAILLWTKKFNNIWKPLYHTFMSIELTFKLLYVLITNKAEYYHIHDLEPGLFAWVGKFIYGGKLVYDAHENEIHRHGPNRVGILSKYEKFIVSNSSLNITVNEDIKLKMQKLHNKPVLEIANRPKYIPYDHIDRERLRTEFALRYDQKVIMYVGYVIPWLRGVEIVLEALEHESMNDCVFLIMGVGRLDEFKNHLKNYAEKKGLKNAIKRVLFIGPYSPDEIVHYLNGADVSMLLYQSDQSFNQTNNAPNKLYQSIMARTPVLASHNETFPVYIYGNGIGKIGETVRESSVDDVRMKILTILDKDNQELYRRNANLLAQEVSWEAEASKLIEAYELLN